MRAVTVESLKDAPVTLSSGVEPKLWYQNLVLAEFSQPPNGIAWNGYRPPSQVFEVVL